MCDVDGSSPSAPYLTIPRESGDYAFPNLAQLFPDATGEEFEIGLDAEKLYKLAKAMGNTGVRIRFTNAKADHDSPGAPSALRPMTVRPLGASDDDASAILMPIRISS